MQPSSPGLRHIHSLRPKTRSAIPRVLGILAIIFSTIGLLFSLVQTVGTHSDISALRLEASELGSFGDWITAYLVFAILVFALHLTAGVLSVRYSPRSIKWMNGYAISALLLAVANISITAATYPELLKITDGHMGRIFLDVCALPWPIVVLSLMNLQRTQEACSEVFNQQIPKAKIA